MMEPHVTESTYNGSWKLDGYSNSYKSFRDGVFILQHDSKSWWCELRLRCDPKRKILNFQLTNHIKDVICGKRIILELIDGTNVHVQLKAAQQVELSNKLKLIKVNQLPISPGSMGNYVAPVKTPQRKASATVVRSQLELNTPPPTPPTPSGQFTGVKVKDEQLSSPLSNTGPMDIPSPPPYDKSFSRKEASQNFLAKSQIKSQETLDVPTRSFYGASPQTTSTYSSSYPTMRSSLPRRPGFLPDPRPAGVSPTYSWLTKSPGGVKQPMRNNLQGFSNLGNTCYMNAILQSIFGLDMFTTDLIQSADRVTKQLESDEKKHCLFNVLMNLFLAKKSNSSSDQKRQLLGEVKKNISSSAKRFSGFEQHDAHEFLGQVLDQLKEEMDKINKQIAVKSEATPEPTELNDKNPTASNFEFKITHTITCAECGVSVNNLETFNDMSVDIPPTRALEATWSIQDALDLTFLPEDVDYTCEKCGGKEANVMHKFSKLPRVLIIHLKRYSYNTSTLRNTKLGQNLIIPRYLTLQSQCTEETTPAQPAPEPAEALLKPAKFSFSQVLSDKINNTPKRRLDLDGKEPEHDMSLRKATEQNTNNRSIKTGPRRVRNSFPQDSKTQTDDTDCFISDAAIALPSAPTTDKKFSKESFIPEAMTEEEMFRLAMERSMEDTPQKANDAPQNQDTTPLKSDTTPLKSDTTPLKSDTTPLKSDTTPLKSDTTPLKSDTTPLKSDTTPLKLDATPLKSDSTPRKQVNFSGLDDEMDKSLPKRYQATPHRGGNGLPHSPVVKTILDACTDYDGQNVDQTSVDHNYVADDNDGVNSDKTEPSRRGLHTGPRHSDTRRGLNLEPPYKRSKLDEDVCDSAYNSFTDIEDKNNCVDADADASLLPGKSSDANTYVQHPNPSRHELNSARHELNSSGVDMNVSDEENKENYTPPTLYSPTQDIGLDPINQEPGKQTVNKQDGNQEEVNKQEADPQDEEGKTEEIKLTPEEGYDEETQLRLAIENSLKDLESMDLQQGLDDDLEKAKQLSLQDADGEEEPFVITPQRPKDKRDLKRTKHEEQALKEHGEKGDLPYSYQLVSVVSHIGNSSVSGHYISDTYDMNRKTWQSWNDSHGQHIDWDEIRRERERTGYIFFYVANEVVSDTENYYFQRRSRFRSQSFSELPIKRLSEIPERPASTIKLGFRSTRGLELR